VRLWIDTDVGTNVDDAVALLAAVAHPAVELVGLSTVGSDPERRASVAVGLLAAAGVDLASITIVTGEPGPRTPAGPSSSASAGASSSAGAGASSSADAGASSSARPDQAGPAASASPRAMEPASGAAAVVEAVAASGAEALLAIGPLTNVAAMTVAGVRPAEVTIMGGALRPVEHRGEVRIVEHNFASDPDAAATVLAVPGAIIVPLDATVATRLDDRLVLKLVATAPVLEPMVQAWVDRWGEIVLHDPAALLIAAGDGPELGRFERRRLLVEPDGRLVDGGRGASGTVHDVVTSLFGVAVIASVLALLADLKLSG
jgi:inosine-uridine nucleoside N-ribohydrolase